MNRAPFQTLVLPFRKLGNGVFEYAIFKCSDSGYWQGIAGGGKIGETPLEAANREAYEEAGIPCNIKLFPLKSMCSVPAYHFSGHIWPKELYVIPEYSFAVNCSEVSITLSSEHIEYHWDNFKNCTKMLNWDSNKTALWELNQKLLDNTLE
ncbi:MAG: NUDIX pyrophosphatase [Planctomycetota bacterium]